MNNNNLYNTNNFIGITHNDIFKISSNALLNEIYNTSNILEQHLYNTSNILDSKASNFTTTTSNLILARYDPMIREEIEEIILPFPITLKHTYISNSNLLGEIRFWCESTKDFIVFDPIGVPDYRVKIDVDGKLKVYYTFDPSINLTFMNGWVDVGNSIAALNASDANIGISIGGLEAQINLNLNYLEGEIQALLVSMMGHGLINREDYDNINESLELFRTDEFVNANSIPTLFTNIRNLFRTGRLSYLSQISTILIYRISQNPITSAFLGIGGVVVGFAIGFVQNQGYVNTITARIEENARSNINITSGRRSEILESNLENQVDTYIELCSNMYNISVNQGFITSNITTEQFIPNLKCDSLNLNTGNISGINYINVNNIVADGKIKENNKFLDTTYLTSNHIYNLGYTYTAERQYPSKLYTSIQPEDTATLLNKLVYRSLLYLDNQSISHGSGFYEIYSSSTFDFPTTKDKLFNFNTDETTDSARWGISLYNSGTGNYQGDNSIDNTYYGDWVIIKMPQPIMLTRYRIYQRTDFPTKAPSLWKCYGSNDGIIFTEITEANQTTRLTSYSGGFYEKSLNPTFTVLYSYIGFVFSSLLSTSGQTDLSFAELQLFGKEILSNNIISNIYTTSNVVKSIVRNEMADVPKRKVFIVSIPSSATFFDATSTTTFYKWDLDLRNYTTTQTIASDPPTGDLLRIFKISFWYVPSYFSSYLNAEPYVVSYTVYMSNKSNPIFGKPETAGVNIYAVGFPENIKLNNILPNNLMLLKNYFNNFNYLTIVSRNAPADIYVIIEDQLF